MGDFSFGSIFDSAGVLNSVNGCKILIRGNHDRRSNSHYIRLGFDIVLQTMQFSNIIFSHYPVDIYLASEAFGTQLDLNMYGHFHNALTKSNFDMDKFKQKYPFYGKNHRLFALEYTKYEPVELTQFLKEADSILF